MDPDAPFVFMIPPSLNAKIYVSAAATVSFVDSAPNVHPLSSRQSVKYVTIFGCSWYLSIGRLEWRQPRNYTQNCEVNPLVAATSTMLLADLSLVSELHDNPHLPWITYWRQHRDKNSSLSSLCLCLHAYAQSPCTSVDIIICGGLHCGFVPGRWAVTGPRTPLPAEELSSPISIIHKDF